MSKLINIITRTSNRPNAFKRNVQSVKNQTYKNYRHIVLYDEIDDYQKYLKNYDGIELHFVNKNKLLNDYNGIELDDPNFWLTPYNLYCNVGLDLVKDGWIIFLDDDNYLLNETSLEEITKQLNDEDCAYIWKIEYDDLSTIPSEKSFIDKKIILGDIDTQCITFHFKWAKYCKWDKYKCSDFRFIVCLTKHIPKGEFIDKRFIKVPYAGFGKKNDI